MVGAPKGLVGVLFQNLISKFLKQVLRACLALLIAAILFTAKNFDPSTVPGVSPWLVDFWRETVVVLLFGLVSVIERLLTWDWKIAAGAVDK